MTTTTTTKPVPTPTVLAPSRVTRILCCVAVAASLPYALLKVAWLSGSRIGLADPEFGTSATMYLANALTLALDISAAILALCFATRRGLRAPTWLVAFPMWVGYGLLALMILLLPVTLMSTTGSSASADGADAIRPWVYTCVYLGFAGLGLCLLPAFALYARRRWAARLRRPVNAVAPQRITLWAVLPAAACTVGAFGGAVLLDGDTRLGLAMDCVLAGVGTVGLATLLLARSRMPAWVPLLAAFTGTGALFAWGLFHLVLEIVPNDLVTDAVPAIAIVYSAGRMIAGIAGGLALRHWWLRTA